jgi:hypothetical protein
MDKVFIVGLAFMAVLVALIAVSDVEKGEQAQQKGLAMDCEYIGRARDLGTVAFFDCKGEIVMRRVE